MSFIISNLGFRYPGAVQPALCNLEFTIPNGQTVAVLGCSGSGKTTLLNLLGLLWDRWTGPEVTGNIIYKGRGDPVSYGALSGTASALRRTDFGFVLQSAYLLPQLTCEENITMPLQLAGWPLRRRRDAVERLVASLDQDEGGFASKILHKSARSLAGGEQQRVAVLRALIHDPQVIFADEPMSSLDFDNAENVSRLLQSWVNEDRLLILVSHDLQAAWEMADSFVLMRKGLIVRGGPLVRSDISDGEATIRRLLMDREIPAVAVLGHGQTPFVGGAVEVTVQDQERDSLGAQPRATHWRFSDLLRFAWKDLTDSSTLWSSVINVLNVTLVLICATLAIGFHTGAQRVTELRHLKNCLALRLTIGNSISEDLSLNSERLATLSNALTADLGAEGKRWYLCPYQVVDLRVGETLLKGRTVNSTELKLLRRARLIRNPGRWLESDAEPGLILSPTGAAECNFDLEKGSIVVYPQFELAVRGITEEPLPDQKQFIIGETAYLKFVRPNVDGGKASNANSAIKNFSTKKLPKEWLVQKTGVEMALRTFREGSDKAKWVHKYKLELAPVGGESKNATVLTISPKAGANGETAAMWRQHLVEIIDHVTKSLVLEKPDYDLADVSHVPTGSEDPTVYDEAGLFTLSPSDIELVKKAATKAELPPNDQTTSRMEQLTYNLSAPSQILPGLLVVLGAIAMGNVSLIQNLRLAAKLREVGMLRAIGMKNSELAMLYAVEGGLLGLVAACTGIALGVFIGPFASSWLYLDPAEVKLGFEVVAWDKWAMGVTAILLLAGSSVVGALRGWLRSPCDSLRG